MAVDGERGGCSMWTGRLERVDGEAGACGRGGYRVWTGRL